MKTKALKHQIIFLVIFMTLTIVVGLIGAYKVGFAIGVEHHKNAQIIYGSGSQFYSEYEGRLDSYYYDEPCTTVQTITNLNTFDNFIVKDSKGSIIYKGDGQNMTLNLKESPVLDMGVCEDAPQTLCIFIN